MVITKLLVLHEINELENEIWLVPEGAVEAAVGWVV